MTERTFTMRAARLVAALVVVLLMASPPGTPRRLEAASRQASAQVAPAPPTRDYVFSSGAGMLFFYVKPDKSAEFEAVVARLSQVLDRTEDPVRKQQAASWRILKSVELQTDSPVYVFVFDPAVVGADYDPVKVLSEAAPAELQALYAKLKDATIRVERMALVKLR
jgi:hypothetical protein